MIKKKINKATKLSLNQSEKLWKNTIQKIPTGAQTFSKAPFQHVNGVSPKFLVSGKGCRVIDIDGNNYIDYMLGLGPIILGHANKKISLAVKNAMDLGTCMSLPSYLETELAEQLIDIIPCAEMVRFGKNGSDVTTAAVRAARAIKRKDKIACCGYHGWQDWFIGTTGRNIGVPKSVSNLTLTFEYNNIDSLEKIFNENPDQIAGVIMEPVNFYEPRDNFLDKVKEITHKNDAILIFDEVITGFRMSLGGAQSVYDIKPDLACFGKSMANGMPLSAIVGKSEYMKIFDDIFFSFTFGGELASIAAAKETIKILKETKGLDHIDLIGKRLKDGYNKITESLKIEYITKMIGFNFWPEYLFFDKKGKNSLEIQSLFQQEIVRRGILSRAGMFVSLSHKNSDIDHTLKVFEESLEVVKEAIKKDKVVDWLDGDVIQPVIRKT